MSSSSSSKRTPLLF